MIFSSPVFLFAFLPCVLLLYYLSPRKFRNFVLFVSSLLFYLWGEPVYLWNMLFTVLFGYLCGICIEKARECGKRVFPRRF